MVKIAICDDEAEMCKSLEQAIRRISGRLGEAFHITCFTDPAGLLCASPEFGLFILDIQMPGLDGVTLAREIRKRNDGCALIFTTVLKEYMLDAFEVEAVDYILKPIDEGRLENALKRALKRIRSADGDAIMVRAMNGVKAVRISTIYYCEVINRKIYMHTRDGVIDYYGKLEDVEKQLDYRFFKCHRSYLVNLDYLLEYAGGRIVLENGEQVPVSRLRHQDLMKKMVQYMKNGGE